MIGLRRCWWYNSTMTVILLMKRQIRGVRSQPGRQISRIEMQIFNLGQRGGRFTLILYPWYTLKIYIFPHFSHKSKVTAALVRFAGLLQNGSLILLSHHRCPAIPVSLRLPSPRSLVCWRVTRQEWWWDNSEATVECVIHFVMTQQF